MTGAMSQSQGLLTKVADVGDEDAGAMQQKPRILAPSCSQLACTEALQYKGGVGRRGCSAADIVEEGEGWPREGRHGRWTTRGRRGLLVPAGEGVRSDVEAA